MRVIVQNDPSHPDNLGHIVTHLGMNLDQRLKEFKQFERDDEAFWAKVIGGEEPEVPSRVKSGDARLSASESPVVVSGEIVDSLFEEDFTSLEDQHIIADLKDRLALLGLDPSQAEEIVRKSKAEGFTKTHAAASVPIQPQRQLAQARINLTPDRKIEKFGIVVDALNVQLSPVGDLENKFLVELDREWERAERERETARPLSPEERAAKMLAGIIPTLKTQTALKEACENLIRENPELERYIRNECRKARERLREGL